MGECSTKSPTAVPRGFPRGVVTDKPSPPASASAVQALMVEECGFARKLYRDQLDAYMTSFVAWLGADSRGPTSLYFASDSRITWGKDKRGWETGRKVFGCQSAAELFGFTGYILLPQSIITRVVDFIDSRVLPPLAGCSASARVETLRAIVQREVDSHLQPFEDDFSVFYAAREGEGMPPHATFHVFEVYCNAARRSVEVFSFGIPAESSMLVAHGTGAGAVRGWVNKWALSDQGGTSRAVFSAFCDSLRSGEDPRTGGEPQLVGLYRQGHARQFGVVSAKGASIGGLLQVPVDPRARIEWRDELFQRVEIRGRLKNAAQRHSRPEKLADRPESA